MGITGNPSGLAGHPPSVRDRVSKVSQATGVSGLVKNAASASPQGMPDPPVGAPAPQTSATGSRPLVTFDLFSALIDSRSGGSRFFHQLATLRTWPVGGSEVYAEWDRRNKLLQAVVVTWVPFAQLAEQALRDTYGRLGLSGDPGTDCASLVQSVREWPLWPDVEAALDQLAQHCRIGVLSNVDDQILTATRAWPLIDPAHALTSQRLGCYKPGKRIYALARDSFGVNLHVAASARDVRGAGEAGLACVRIVRPGHHLDPGGPVPRITVADLSEITVGRFWELRP